MFFDPMKTLTDLDGKVIREGDKDVTFGLLAASSLLQPEADGQGRPMQISVDEQITRGKLAYRLHGSTMPVEITVEEAALIKKLVGKRGVILFTMQVAEALDNPAPPKTPLKAVT